MAVLIDGTPETMLFAADGNKHPVEELFVARRGRRRLNVLANIRPNRWPQLRMLS